MKCTKCGNELKINSKFCGNCGVSAAGAPSAQQDVKQQSNTSDTSQQDVAATEQEELTPLDISLLPLGEKEYNSYNDRYDKYGYWHQEKYDSDVELSNFIEVFIW